MLTDQLTCEEYTAEPLAELRVRDLHADTYSSAPVRERRDWALLGESVAARQLRSQIGRIAPYFRIALIRGECGSGKQAVARAIHALSPRGQGPFLVRDAYDVAAATGRSEVRRSQAAPELAPLLDAARGGTLYLTSVGELSFNHQAALFRFIQECGERNAGPANLLGCPRIMAATRRDLRTLAATGQLRQDLYARLSAVEILVPPLRQRAEDIGTLAEAVLSEIAAEAGANARSLSANAISRLEQRMWPQNLHELERVVVHAAALAEGGTIELRHLAQVGEPDFANPATPGVARMEPLQNVIERHVMDVLTHCGGNKLRAAEVLGISRSTLYRMLGVQAASGCAPE